MYLENFYAFILFFINTQFYMVVIIFGLFGFDKKRYTYLFLASVTAAVMNQFLKWQWQIPFDESLHKFGFAYPSGHTTVAVVFWGMLCIIYKNRWLYVAAFIILLSSFFGMVYFHFHTWWDIFGGICFGAAFVGLNYLWMHRYEKRVFLYAVLAAAAQCILYYLMPKTAPASYYYGTWQVLGATLMFCGMIITLYNKVESYHVYSPILSLILIIILFSMSKVISLPNNMSSKMIEGGIFIAVAFVSYLLLQKVCALIKKQDV